jgi:hypothetical protein
MQHPTIWHAPTPSRKKKKKVLSLLALLVESTDTDVLSAALVSAQQSASRSRRPSTPASAPSSKTCSVPILLLTKYLIFYSPSA